SKRVPELLLDHANCELKAASTALGIIYRYPDRAELVDRMSRLAREELRHFEQVRQIMRERNLPFMRLSASRYAGQLRAAVSGGGRQSLADLLIVGALIEARSCERFAAIAPHLDQKLSRFYQGLLASEARHFEHYLAFARSESGLNASDFGERLSALQSLESELISSPDPQFRFHSGRPETPAVPG
ncbi:MAG: tRNA isopentenyl-2-thiomethyl-A-37 hydroxylase MiaE, partial [Woeseiaceae bacterium]